MTPFLYIEVAGLLAITIVWPVILAAWALPEARIWSILTFILSVALAVLLALDTWAPAVFQPYSVALVVAASLLVVAPMASGFYAAWDAQGKGRVLPRWLVGSFLIPEVLLVTAGAAYAWAFSRLLFGPTYEPSWFGVSRVSGWMGVMAFPAGLAALGALIVTVWSLVRTRPAKEVPSA